MILYEEAIFFVLGFAANDCFCTNRICGKSAKSSEGWGKVSINQESRLTRLLNGDTVIVQEKKVEEKNVNSEKHKIDAKKDEEKVSVDSSEANGSVRPVKMKRYKISGYRIQIYAGNNSRNSRVEAERVAQRFKGFFPKVPAYTHFYPPRWVCRVGDFKTAEQATAFMSQIQQLKAFSGLIVVKTAIQVAYRSDVSE